MIRRTELPIGFFMPEQWWVHGWILDHPGPWALTWWICAGHGDQRSRILGNYGAFAKHRSYYSEQLAGWYCGSSLWIYYMRNISNGRATS
jgi:hypothetical protein